MEIKAIAPETEVISQENIVESPKEEAKELTVREEIEKTAKEIRARDDSGKFAKKSTDLKESAPKAKESPVQAQEQPQKDLPPKVTPPNSWTAAAKAKWEKLEPDVQQEILKREKEVETGFTRLDEDRAAGKAFKDVVAPYVAMINAEGGTPVTAIKELLNTAYLLRTASPQAKGQLILQLARQFGADLSVSQSQQKIDPQLQAIQQKLANLEQQHQSELTQREQQEQATVQGQIAAFASDPKHIHFETVKPHMAALLQNGLAKDMEDAYEQAVYARPDIRSTLLQSQTADTEAKRVADAKAKADAARKASGSVQGSPGATAPKNPSIANRSLREELQANYRSVANG